MNDTWKYIYPNKWELTGTGSRWVVEDRADKPRLSHEPHLNRVSITRYDNDGSTHNVGWMLSIADAQHIVQELNLGFITYTHSQKEL